MKVKSAKEWWGGYKKELLERAASILSYYSMGLTTKQIVYRLRLCNFHNGGARSVGLIVSKSGKFRRNGNRWFVSIPSSDKGVKE